MHKLDVGAILTTVAGVGALATDAAFGTQMQQLFGAHANAILAGIGAAGLIAATVLRVNGAPSTPNPTQAPQPAQKE